MFLMSQEAGGRQLRVGTAEDAIKDPGCQDPWPEASFFMVGRWQWYSLSAPAVCQAGGWTGKRQEATMGMSLVFVPFWRSSLNLTQQLSFMPHWPELIVLSAIAIKGSGMVSILATYTVTLNRIGTLLLRRKGSVDYRWISTCACHTYPYGCWEDSLR